MVTKVFQLLLLISPIAVSADISIDIFDLIFFRTGVIILFMATFFDTIKREIPQYIKYAMVSLVGLCIFNMLNHPLAQAVLLNTFNVFLAVIAFSIIYTHYDTSKSLKKFIIIPAIINFCFFLCQSIGFDPVFDKTLMGGLNGAFLGNTARLSNYFTLIVAFLPVYFLPIVLLFGLYIKQYVVLIPVIIILLKKPQVLKTRILLFVSLGIFFIIFYSHIMRSFSVRVNDAWFPMLVGYFDKPLIGLGAGIYPEGIQTGVILNSFLQTIIGLGAYAILWFGYIFYSIYKRIGIRNLSIPFITLALLMLIEYPIEMVRLWFLIIAILIMFLVNQKQISDA